MARPRKHREQWLELRPLDDSSALRKVLDEESQEIPLYGGSITGYSAPTFHYEFGPKDFEVVVHDKPTENLQKLLDLGYKEGACCRILDTLGLE